MMGKDRSDRLLLEVDDEEWDELVEEEEELDDIIDEEEEDDVKTVRQRSSKRRAPGKKRVSGRRGRGASSLLENPAVKWGGRILITIIVVFLLFAPIQPFTDMREAAGLDSLKNLLRPYRSFPEWVNVTMEVSYDLSVRYGAADSVDIQMAVPFDIPLTDSPRRDNFVVQNVDTIISTPEPTEGISDFDREMNVLSGWTFEPLVQGSYQFLVRYDVRLYTYEWKMEEEESGYIEDIDPSYQKYLGDDWPVLRDGDIIDEDRDGIPDLYRYHPGDPEITSIARELTEGEDTVLGKVRAIYDWVQENFNYTTPEQRIRDSRVYGNMPKWPTGCLADWYGDCDDQSLLMASLCRAVDVPAWLEIGYLYDQVRDEWGGHGWFNVIIPQRGTGSSIIAPIDPVNSEFLFRDPFRITDWIDNGSYVEEDGKTLYNLDDYYNFFALKRPAFVDVDIETSFRSLRFEEHGSIKKYVDEKIEPGNLQGSEQPIPSLPYPNPLLAVPALLILIAIPARRFLIKRSS